MSEDTGGEKRIYEETKRMIMDRMRFNMDEFTISGLKLRTGMKVVVEVKGRKYEPIMGVLRGYNPVLGLLIVETETSYKIVRMRDIKVITVLKEEAKKQ